MKLKDEIAVELMVAIRKHGSEVVIPNFYFGNYEFDVFRLLNNGNVYEYEIKTSRADFKNDFKKKRRVRGSEYVIEVTKHEEIDFGNYSANKFFFVVPEGMIKPEEVPKNMGLIYYGKDEFGATFKVKRPAKFINKNKIEFDQMEMIKKLAFRELNLREKIEYLKKIKK